MEINTKEELLTLLADLQGQMANMQETVDKLAPVEEEAEKEEETATEEETLSDEEVSEIDKLLQED